MTFALAFWILMTIWLFFGVWQWRDPHPYGPIGNSLFLFVLFLLLGWKVFGAPLH